MLKTLDIAIREPGICPLRRCSTDPEFCDDYNKYCYCEFFIDRNHYQCACTDEKVFPADCPLNKNNLNLWRSK